MLAFLKAAFSDNGTPSSSRIIAAISTLASVGWITYMLIHSHVLPDVATLGGLTAFGTAHYAVNRFSQMGK